MMRPNDITIRDLSLGYGLRIVVQGMSCRIAAGSLTAVVGPNGAGKSTLLRAVAGLLRPRKGAIDTGGMAARQIAYLPQQADIDRTFPIRVQDMVALGLWPETGVFGGIGRGRWRKVHEALDRVGMLSFAARDIGAISVGQFQRVQFARLLLQDASVILLDEPFTALDAATTADLLRMVESWHDEGRTVLAVIHDLEQVRATFPLCLSFMGQAPVLGPTRVLLAHCPLCDRSAADDEEDGGRAA